MRYAIFRETTGKVGGVSHQRTVQVIREYGDREEALTAIRSRRKALDGKGVKLYGSEEDFFVVLQKGPYDAVQHYYFGARAKETTTFVLNPVETARLHAFVARHRGHVRSGSAGEWLRVYFTPTGLGTISEVRCLSCRETEDLTDYDQW